MELILGIILLLIVMSCAGWILKFLGFVGKHALGCLFKGVIYLVCAYIIIMVIVTMLGML